MEERPVNLQQIAKDTLLRFGFLVETPSAAQSEADRLAEPDFSKITFKDLSDRLWSSIDNDDSRDLDQIEYAEKTSTGYILSVAIADVTALVAQNGPLDQAGWHNTTSLYTGVRTVPLFPERLSTNLTSLVEGEKRLAIVAEMQIAADGKVMSSTVYPAVVRNQAQLTYHAVAAWLENEPGDHSPVTERMLGKIRAYRGLQQQLRLQKDIAELLRERRLDAGALTFETIELKPTATLDGQWELQMGVHNVATHLIEDFMIAANQAAVSFLQSKNLAAIRRVVRTPKNWPRIVELAAARGASLPALADAGALEQFLAQERRKDPERFPDLSLSVIKLLGRGEYVVAMPDGDAPGHFSLAVEGYAHSTAPNRRYPDVITQRLLKAAFGGGKVPYSSEELALLAQHCTEKENDAQKAERSIHKSIAAYVMSKDVGQIFEGFITGAPEKGVWVRLLKPPIEGKVEGAIQGLAVGERVRVKLVRTDPWRGYIDFVIA